MKDTGASLIKLLNKMEMSVIFSALFVTSYVDIQGISHVTRTLHDMTHQLIQWKQCYH